MSEEAGRTHKLPQRLVLVVEMMRAMSGQTEPQQMVRTYASRMANVLERDRMITLSRRYEQHPWFRVTRDSERADDVNPWTQRDRLPLLCGGLLADLLYGGEPRIIADLQVSLDDPGAPYVAGQRSLEAIPLFDQGAALNMVVFMRKEPAAFRPEDLPDHILLSNLFGRATHNLVLTGELRRAYEEVDKELRAVADIQRALLPAELPKIDRLDVAAYYQTARRAGGDYYDLFPLGDGRWGILIADVAGKGTPAAVLMAITHTLAHTAPEPPSSPGRLLTRMNHQLTAHYTHELGTFVTAFYGVFDSRSCRLTYANAGHAPPRVRRCADGSVVALDRAHGLPLGVLAAETYAEAEAALAPGDQVVLYTDGITESFNRAGELFGTARLDAAVALCGLGAAALVRAVTSAVEAFAEGGPLDDDRTVLVAKVT
ncbi:MAG: PP2C family protein-serine/threonine phosphatase [Planctomycetota bacterium]